MFLERLWLRLGLDIFQFILDDSVIFLKILVVLILGLLLRNLQGAQLRPLHWAQHALRAHPQRLDALKLIVPLLKLLRLLINHITLLL